MGSNVEKGLLALFEGIDTTVKWGLTPQEAVKITLLGEETYLRKHTLDSFCYTAETNLEGASYARLGVKQQFYLDSLKPLRKILSLSQYARMDSKIIDLRDSTSLTLSDGTTVKINSDVE